MTNTTDSASAQPIRVALLGCGVVGSQVARMIESRTEDIAARVGRQVELAGIAVAHPDRPRQGLDSRLLPMIPQCSLTGTMWISSSSSSVASTLPVSS